MKFEFIEIYLTIKKELDMNDNDFMDMLWKYFELHSNQRIQLINFYIVLESLLVAGLISLLSIQKDLIIWECGVCGAIIFFSLIFYGLDRRTKQMIKLCEDIIKQLEKNHGGQSGPVQEWIGIFSKEEYISRSNKEKWTYSKLFKLQYFFFIIIAIIMFFIIA